MKRFAALIAALDETDRTTDKVAALTEYFAEALPADAAWGLYLLMGRKPRQTVPVRKLVEWACEVSDVPAWLFDECYEAVGDLAETVAHILPEPTGTADRSLAESMAARLLPLRTATEAERKAAVLDSWNGLAATERFVWNKLVAGSFRVGVAHGLVLRGLAAASNIAPETLAERLTGEWTPSAEFFAATIAPEGPESETLRPSPFFLAHPLEAEPPALGDPAAWHAEWKWDGVRAQFLSKNRRPTIWSRGEEVVTERFPELHVLAPLVPDGTIIDGELLPFKDGAALPFAELQTRIGRKAVGKKLLAAVPVRLMAYDLLALAGEDLRQLPFAERRERLERLVAGLPPEAPLVLSPKIPFASWEELAAAHRQSRARGVEGVMLKRRDSPYRVGRVCGDWWTWKVEPLTVDAVLTAAQRGRDKRASLYTDYTFSVWQDGALVTLAKANAGLDDAEVLRVDRFVREHTLERFGPVRTVEPKLVFELSFENVARSSRHKSGVAVRLPRILRWRVDKQPEDADTLETVVALIASETGAVP